MRGDGRRLMKFSKLMVAFRTGCKMSIHESITYTKGNEETIRHHIAQLHEAGLIHIAGWGKGDIGPQFPIYGWAEPLGAEDVKRPHLKLIKAA
jgi:hypothetical protein